MSNYISISCKKISSKDAFENISKEMERDSVYIEKEERTNINSSRTYLNVTLIKNKYKTYEEFLDTKKEEIKIANKLNGTKHRMIKKDVATQYNFSIQASNEALTFQEHQLFLKEIAIALQQYLSENEIIEAHIHNDETTPHLQICMAFFDKEKKKFNQKDNIEKTKIDNILKALEPIYSKYRLIKHLTIEQKIESLNEKDTNKLNEIIKNLTTEKEIKQAKKRFLKSIYQYGGDSYTLPNVLKNENHEITKKLNEDIKKSLEKLEHIHIRDTTQIMQNLKDWDKSIETSLFFRKKENGYFINEAQYKNIISFHCKMSNIYREINEHNLLLQSFKTKLEALGLKGIEDIEEYTQTHIKIEQDIEILNIYKKDLEKDIQSNEAKLKNLNETCQTLSKEANSLEQVRQSNNYLIFNSEKLVIEKEKMLASLDQKIAKINNEANQLENNLITLSATHDKARIAIIDIFEEEKQTQKEREKIMIEERAKIHKQPKEEKKEGIYEPEIHLTRELG